MKLSVVVCTWNRGASLSRTLRSIADADKPRQAEWEVVVVDNNSTDDTAAVVRRLADTLPVRHVFEPAPGLSHARNRAAAEAAGDYIVWTDDDVRVDRDWLVAYERAFRRHPEAAIFGGAIRPAFEGTPPAWLPPALHCVDTAYALRTAPGDGVPIARAAEGMPFGANYAVRIAEQRRHLYDTELGKRPGRTLGVGEETDLIGRLLDDGASGVWVADAIVDHLIPRARQSRAYLRRYYRAIGAACWIANDEVNPRHHPLTVRKWRTALWWETRYRWRSLTGEPTAWVPLMRDSALAWGAFSARFAAPARSSGR